MGINRFYSCNRDDSTEEETIVDISRFYPCNRDDSIKRGGLIYGEEFYPCNRDDSTPDENYVINKTVLSL